MGHTFNICNDPWDRHNAPPARTMGIYETHGTDHSKFVMFHGPLNYAHGQMEFMTRQDHELLYNPMGLPNGPVEYIGAHGED
jgi:hypothetical protein